MCVAFAGQAMDKCKLVGPLGKIGEHVRDHLSRLASRSELVLGTCQIARRPLESHRRSTWHRGSIQSDQIGFVIPCFQLTACTCTEQYEDIPGLGWKMGVACLVRARGINGNPMIRQQPLLGKKLSERHRTQSGGCGSQEMPSVQQWIVFSKGMHHGR